MGATLRFEERDIAWSEFEDAVLRAASGLERLGLGEGDVACIMLKNDEPGKWARIDYVDPSPFDPASAYMVADYHKSGDRAPHFSHTS